MTTIKRSKRKTSPDVSDASRPTDPKNKKVSPVPLSKLARDIIALVPIFDAEDDKGFVFTNSGRGPLGDWSKCKKRSLIAK